MRPRLPFRFRRLEELRPGKSVAIARALSVASGEILAFTDDDVNVGARWLEELQRGLSADDIALVGGPMLPRWERQPPKWLAAGGAGRLTAPLALVDYGSQPIELGSRTAMGGNMAIRREVITRLGGFAPHLGSIRGTLRTGEDQDLCRRVQAAGYRAVYQPSAVVHHWVPANRVSVRYFLRWYFWSGIANAAQEEAGPRHPRAVFGVPRYLIKRFAVGVATAPALALFGRTTQAVDRAIDAAFAVGYAAKRWGLSPATVQAA